MRFFFFLLSGSARSAFCSPECLPTAIYYKGPRVDLSAGIKQDGIVLLTQGVKINQYELWWTLCVYITSTYTFMPVTVQRWLSLQFMCWHFYERLWFMDLILSQISKSYVTRLVCNKMLIVPYIIKCKSIYATIYYTDSKLQHHLFISATVQWASRIFLLAFNRIMPLCMQWY